MGDVVDIRRRVTCPEMPLCAACLPEEADMGQAEHPEQKRKRLEREIAREEAEGRQYAQRIVLRLDQWQRELREPFELQAEGDAH